MEPQKKLLSCEEALHFRNEFREARAAALKDAEGYQQILFVLERLGAYMFEKRRCEGHKHKKANGLKDYKNCIRTLVNKHHPFRGNPPDDYHIAFDSLYNMVREGRNDALHQGAVARNMTLRSVELSLMLEDTLTAILGGEIKKLMVRNPVRAYAWQPVSFVRQMMLENSFSYIPVWMKKNGDEKERWYLIADYHIAKYLLPANGARNKLLAQPIEEAEASGAMTIERADRVCPDKTVEEVLECTKCAEGKPVLVVKRDDCRKLLGIATAFDLM